MGGGGDPDRADAMPRPKRPRFSIRHLTPRTQDTLRNQRNLVGPCSFGSSDMGLFLFLFLSFQTKLRWLAFLSVLFSDQTSVLASQRRYQTQRPQAVVPVRWLRRLSGGRGKHLTSHTHDSVTHESAAQEKSGSAVQKGVPLFRWMLERPNKNYHRMP